MFFVVLIIIIIFVLSTVGFVIQILVLRGLTRMAKRRGEKNPTPAVPQADGLSDSELEIKISRLHKWDKVPRICGLAAVAYIFGGIIIAFVLSGDPQVRLSHFIVTALVLGVLFVIAVTSYKKRSVLKRIMSTEVALPVLREVFEIDVYRPYGYIGSSLIDGAGFFVFYNRVDGSDYIKGKYRGVNFEFSDVHLQREDTTASGRKVNRTVFKGQWLVCEFVGGQVSATIRLEEKEKAIFGSHKYVSGMTNIATENTAFNEKYHIITDDEHAAFYLLTPHFMERMVSLDEAAEAQTFFCFENGRVHIALYNWRDSFELGNTKPSEIGSLRQKFRGELKYLTDIIDELMLNEKLYTGG